MAEKEGSPKGKKEKERSQVGERGRKEGKAKAKEGENFIQTHVEFVARQAIGAMSAG